MFDLVTGIISHVYDVLVLADIPFVVALGVVLVALGFLGKLARPSQTL